MKDKKKDKKKSKWRKFLRYSFYFAIIFVCLSTLFLIFVEEMFEYTPPEVAGIEEKIKALQNIEKHENYFSLGESWSKRESELLLLYSKGDSFTIGYSSGKLVGQIAPKLEDALLERVEEIVGSTSLIWLFRKIGYVIYSDLQNYFSKNILQEVYGYSLAVPDTHPELGSSYFRALNYQAAHDTGHRVMESVLSLQGCTSFAAWGEATKNGNLIIGRNFDFEIGDVFDRFKMIQVVVPEKGIPFISVSWPGMSGVVSGVNKKLISITINAGKSDHFKWKATPVTIAARNVLEQASTIEEAIAILRASSSYVSESFLIGDGKTKQAVVVEKSPGITRVRKPKLFKDAITCANHFLDEDFQSHENHRIFVKEGSSPKRLARIRELISENNGKITPRITAKILRDFKLEKNKDIGLSHLHTINASICSHSIIMDLTDGVIWVNTGPNQSGKYMSISINDIFEHDPKKSFILNDKIIKQDDIISPEKILELKTWRKNIRKWRKKEWKNESEFVQIVELLITGNKNHFLTFIAQGDLYFYQKKYKKAHDMWQNALNQHPYGEWISDITERIERGK